MNGGSREMMRKRTNSERMRDKVTKREARFEGSRNTVSTREATFKKDMDNCMLNKHS